MYKVVAGDGMDFSVFKNRIEILDKKLGDTLRDQYCNKFVNVNEETFQEQIVSRHKFIDGYCYLGYLWDYIINPIVIKEEDIEKKAADLSKVYVFWDINSCERIFIKDYWKFDKDAVLKMNMATLLQGEGYLPEDIYIFDESFTWTLIKTHEDIQGTRFCLKAGEI